MRCTKAEHQPGE